MKATIDSGDGTGFFEQNDNLGRRSVHVITFGCQMNQYDSELIAGLLRQAGYATSETPEGADIIIFNTCCVRAHAEQRLYTRVSQLKRAKARNPDLIIGIGGCVAQREKGVLLERFPHVDIVFGTNAQRAIVGLVKQAEQGVRPVVETPEKGPIPDLGDVLLPGHRGVKANVSVMRGCDNYCTYCVVPFVRGPQSSKSPQRIIDEVSALAQQGIVEVTLLGQNVNSYGEDLSSGVRFPRLLELLNEVPGIVRIRFTSSHPKDISDELMQAMRDLSKVCEHLHLPVQSGSSRILRLMNRKYLAEDYLRKVDRLREIVPEISLTTDVIVGFPGETDSDFEQTRLLLERVGFDGAYIFKYSRREGTAAARLEEAVDEATIARRHRQLLDFQKDISLKRLRALVGTVQSALPESPDNKRCGYLLGRTRGHRVVTLRVGSRLTGTEVDANITGLEGWTLLGEAVETERR